MDNMKNIAIAKTQLNSINFSVLCLISWTPHDHFTFVTVRLKIFGQLSNKNIQWWGL